MDDGLDPRTRESLLDSVAGGDASESRARRMELAIEQQIGALRRHRRIMKPMFVYLTIFCAALLTIAGYSDDPGRRLWFGIQACFWFIFGAMIMLRYHLDRIRLDLMAELTEIRIDLARLADQQRER